MSLSLSDVQQQISSHGLTRESLVEIANNAQNLPQYLRYMAFMAIMGMSDEQLAQVAGMAAGVLEKLISGDYAGLKAVMQAAKVPPVLVDGLINYARNLHQNQ